MRQIQHYVSVYYVPVSLYIKLFYPILQMGKVSHLEVK